MKLAAVVLPQAFLEDLHLDGSLAYTSKLANSAAESPTREGRHAPINYKPLSHGYQTWKARPNRKKEKCNLFGRVLYTNMQVEWLSNTINRLCQLPRQVRPSAIEHKLFKHQCLKPAKIPCWSSQNKTIAHSWNLGARKVAAWGANKRRCVWTRKGTKEHCLQNYFWICCWMI